MFTSMGEGKTRVMANASGLGDRIVSAVTNAVPQEGVFQVAQAFRRRVLGVEDCSEFHGHCVATVLQIPAREAKVETLKGYSSFALTSVLRKRVRDLLRSACGEGAGTEGAENGEWQKPQWNRMRPLSSSDEFTSAASLGRPSWHGSRQHRTV